MPKPSPILREVLARLNFIRHKKQEYFVCFSLDSGGRIIRRRVVTIGTLTTTLMHPREVFAEPLKDRAASIIVAHNHPSGYLEPSREDIRATQQLIAAGIILGVKVQDHVIVAVEGYYSFRGKGLVI